MSKYDALNQDRDQKLEKLTANYSAALKRLLDDSKKSGDLDAVLPFRDELAATEANTWPLPALPKTTNPKLRDLRTKYADARAKITKDHATELVALVDKMQELLKAKEADLTKQGDLDGALAARKMGQTLEQDDGIQAARSGLMITAAAPGSGGDWLSLQKLQMTTIEKSKFHCKWADEAFINSMNPKARQLALEIAGSGPMLATHAPAIVEFRAKQTFTSFRCHVFLAAQLGDVAFRIIAGGKQVKSGTLTGKIGGRDVFCEFPASESIRLIVDERDNPNSDHMMWINPQVR